MRTPLLILSLTYLAVFNVAEAACDRVQRTVEFTGKPVVIYSDPDSWPEVVFPEKIAGRLKETPDGLKDRFAPFSDRIYLKTTNPMYSGYMFVHGQSGKTYTLKILARKGCPDSSVHISKPFIEDEQSPNTEARPSKLPNGLFERLVRGTPKDKPSGYTEINFNNTLESKLVFRQGPVEFYIQKVWRGRKYSGTVLMAINQGRTPYYIALEAIDFSSPEVRKAIGKVRKIGMQPIDRRLGAAPEYAVDHFNPQNKGLIYIVSERTRTP